MKKLEKITILIGMSVLLTFSCKKNPPVPVITPASIVGKWSWIVTYSANYTLEPITPKTTGIEELLVFNEDGTWFKKENQLIVDSGKYTLGHNEYISPSSSEYIYDSICYYKNNQKIKISDYYKIMGDTLKIASWFAYDKWFCYTLNDSGSKKWVKLN